MSNDHKPSGTDSVPHPTPAPSSDLLERPSTEGRSAKDVWMAEAQIIEVTE